MEGRPCGPRILVKIERVAEKLKSSLVIPDSALRAETFNSTRGVVVKMGLDCYNTVFKDTIGAKEPWCEEGDIILFRSHASLFQGDSKDGLVIINDQDVLWNYSKE